MITIVVDKIQFKRKPTAERMATVLDDAEPIKDQDTGELYIGDGVTPGGNPVGGSSGGISLATADARYVQQSQVNAAGGVAGLDAGAAIKPEAMPMPAIPFTALVANKLA